MATARRAAVADTAASTVEAKLTVAASAPEVVGQILLIATADIEVGERLRPVDPVWAQALGQMMAIDGQKTAIEVCRLPGRTKWTLVAGGHRHAGAQFAKIQYLRAVDVGQDAGDRLDREISENLDRKDLDPLDRAAFIAERVGRLKAKAGIAADADGRSVSAHARWQKAIQDEAEDANDTMSFAYGWSEQVGERLGLSRRTIERDLLLYRRIPAGLVARLREVDHPALRNAAQLRSLAKLDEADQTAAVDRLLWEEQSEARKPMSLADAIAAGKAKVAVQKGEDDKRLSAFIGAFSRMSIGEKKGALSQLAGMLPAGYKLTFGEQVAANGFPEGYEEARENAFAAIDGARAVLNDILEDAAPGDAVNIDGDRWEEIRKASSGLQLTRFDICGDRVPLDHVNDTMSLASAGDRA